MPLDAYISYLVDPEAFRADPANQTPRLEIFGIEDNDRVGVAVVSKAGMELFFVPATNPTRLRMAIKRVLPTIKLRHPESVFDNIPAMGGPIRLVNRDGSQIVETNL